MTWHLTVHTTDDQIRPATTLYTFRKQDITFKEGDQAAWHQSWRFQWAVKQLIYLGVQSHKKSVGIMFHAGGRPADAKLPGNNWTSSLENRDLKMDKRRHLIKKLFSYTYNRAKQISCICVCETYRTHGDWNVKVLSPIVLLEGVDVKPNLRHGEKGQGMIWPTKYIC